MAHRIDAFAEVLKATDAHRARHRCGAYPFHRGPLLGILSGAMRAERVLELGTALGYTSLWFAHGFAGARVDTIERDPEHVELARRNIARAGLDSRVQVHHGEFLECLPSLPGPYDIAFFDGYAPDDSLLRALRERLRVGGLLIAANLNLAAGSDALRTRLSDPEPWLTHFVGDDFGVGLCLKR